MKQAFYKNSNNFLVSDREDNWSVYNYKERYLDSLARVLMFNSKKYVVSAVYKKDNKYYISYNKSLEKGDEYNLNNICKSIKYKAKEYVIGSYIKNNRLDFINKLKAIKTEETANKALDDYLVEIEKNKNFDIQKTYSDYCLFLEKLLETSPSKILVSTALRPLQDVYKIIFLDLDLQLGDNLILLENHNCLHAEHNILYQVNPDKGTYIGISKLSCADCNKVLWDNLIAHRGTHGMYYSECYQMLEKFFKKNQVILTKIEDIDTREKEGFFKKYELVSQFFKRKSLFEYQNNLLFDKLSRQEKEFSIEDFEKKHKDRYSKEQQADLSDDEFEDLINIDGLDNISLKQFKKDFAIVKNGEGKLKNMVLNMINNGFNMEYIDKYIREQDQILEDVKVKDLIDNGFSASYIIEHLKQKENEKPKGQRKDVTIHNFLDFDVQFEDFYREEDARDSPFYALTLDEIIHT